MIFTFPKWYDLHVHFRQDEPIKEYIQAHIDMGCCGALAMPNTKPPVSKILGENTDKFWTIESYIKLIKENGGDVFDTIIVPLYLTPDTDVAMIEEGAKSGFLKSCKYYPPHGTTNSESGAAMQTYIDNGVLKAMEDNNIILNIHGEEHGLQGAKYFDEDTNAEDVFYKNTLPILTQKFPNLKIVCEHITTKTAVDFVKDSSDRVAATITPQHLMFTVGNLLQGFKYHLYCLPLVKFEKDRQALLDAAKDPKNKKFFAGTDSAPHHDKVTECGCAAGCFTGRIAPQLYAQAFGLDEINQEQFKNFLCLNGANFYGLKTSEKIFTLEKKKSSPPNLKSGNKEIVLLHNGVGLKSLDWTIKV